MFRHNWLRAGGFICFPRARGDVPAVDADFTVARDVFPAHAGMFPHQQSPRNPHRRFPRARGDVPDGASWSGATSRFSPRTRGCSPHLVQQRIRVIVFPAHAGMFPRLRTSWPAFRRFPRARGDVPWPRAGGFICELFSPRTRGCSSYPLGAYRLLNVFPAHAGMFPRIRC